MDKLYFNFFDVPDLIVKNNYKRREYDLILKVLLKVKNSFLEQKMEKEIMKKMQENILKSMKFNQDEGDFVSPRKEKATDDHTQKIADMVITDEDFVPLELFDGVLGEFQHKF